MLAPPKEDPQREFGLIDSDDRFVVDRKMIIEISVGFWSFYPQKTIELSGQEQKF
jgi:hypothetical protein